MRNKVPDNICNVRFLGLCGVKIRCWGVTHKDKDEIICPWCQKRAKQAETQNKTAERKTLDLLKRRKQSKRKAGDV